MLEQIFPRAGETDYGPFRSRVAEPAVWISCSAISSEGIRSGSFASKNSMLVIANHYPPRPYQPAASVLGIIYIGVVLFAPVPCSPPRSNCQFPAQWPGF